VKDFLDRVVARAGRQSTALRPRVAHRFGPPEHHLVPARGEPEPGRGDDEEPSTEGDAASARDDVVAPARAALSSPDRRERVAPAGDASTARGDVAAPPEQERGASVPTSLVPQERAQPERGLAAAAAPVSSGEPPAQGGFVERLRARLREANGASRDARAESRRPVDPIVSPPASGAPDGAAVATAAPPAQPAAGEVASRSIENEAAFWRFLYGPEAEAPASRRRADDDDARATPSVGPPVTSVISSPFESRAASRSSAVATVGTNAPAAPTTITIGRVEVRGLPTPVAPRPAPARRPPRLGLADYMRQTAPGARRR